MDTRPPPFDDVIDNLIDVTTLHAYVDGQLPPDEAARVERALSGRPEAAARVAAWQAQRDGLQALHAGLLDEPVPERLRAALSPVDAPLPLRESTVMGHGPFGSRGALALAAALLLAVGLGMGLGLGWALRGPSGAPSDRLAQAGSLPAFVRDAGVAHVLYTPEQRHPVEVGAEQQQHLVQWLSRRLGQPLRVPVLVDQGWRLVGGRLLPAGEPDPLDGHAALARAQFMYEGPDGARLTLYVAVNAAVTAESASTGTTAFRLGATPAAAAAQAVPRSLYWVDGRLGYALTGTLSAEALMTLARQVHQQLAG